MKGPSRTCRALNSVQPAALHVIVPVSELRLGDGNYTVKGHFQWLSQHWHACTRLKITVSCGRGACACQQASKMLEKICRCQQRLLPLRWLHVRSECGCQFHGKRELQIELLVALAPRLLVADLLQPWRTGQAAPYGQYRRHANSMTRRLCCDSLHHLRVRITSGFDLRSIAGGLPKIQTLHFECQDPLDYYASGEVAPVTLDVSRNTACRQLCLGNIFPGSLIVPHGCQVYIEAKPQPMGDLLGSLNGTYRNVVGLKLHLGSYDDVEDESVLGKLPQLCAAFPRVQSLILHINATYLCLFGESGHVDLQALAALDQLTALQITCRLPASDLSASDLSDAEPDAEPDLSWRVSVPTILSLTWLSIEVLGANSGFHLDMPNLGLKLQQLAVYTEYLDELFLSAVSRCLSERSLRLGALRVAGSQGELSPACYYLMPASRADPPAGSLQEVEHFFRSAVDIPWASCGQFIDQLPGS